MNISSGSTSRGAPGIASGRGRGRGGKGRQFSAPPKSQPSIKSMFPPTQKKTTINISTDDDSNDAASS